MNELYNRLKEPREFTRFDAINIYFGLAVLFFIQAFK